MIVYAVMRGTEFHAFYSTTDLAQKRVDKLNAQFPRGKRYSVHPITVRTDEE